MDKNIRINLSDEIREEVFNRVKFLNYQISIFPSHWFNYWRIETHPTVSAIIFDKKLIKSIVLYIIGFKFGEAVFVKENGNWKLCNLKIVGRE